MKPGVLAFFVAVMLLNSPATRSQDGFYDTSFAPPNGRRALAEAPTPFLLFPSVQLASDRTGRTFVGTSCSVSGAGDRECILQLLEDGSPAAYGPVGNGRYVGPMVDYLVTGLAALPDGRVVVTSEQDLGTAGRLYVLKADGSLPDPATLGGTGELSFIDFAPLELQLDGQSAILIGIGSGELSSYVVVRRYLLGTGTLDPSFGGGERRLVIPKPTPSSAVYVTSAALSHDRRIVIAAQSSDGFSSVLRLLPDGSLDATFGDGGIFAVNRSGPRVAVDSQGQIVVFATGGSQGVFATRLTGAGQVEPQFEACKDAPDARHWQFNYNGSLVTPVEAVDVAVDDDDKLFFSARVRIDGVEYFAVIRTTASGCLDPSFGLSGRTIGSLVPTAADSKPSDIHLGAKGLMVAGTSKYSNGTEQFGIARLRSASALLDDGFESP